jgi:hypothetical protein
MIRFLTDELDSTRKRSLRPVMNYSGICLEGLRRTSQISQDFLSSGRDLNRDFLNMKQECY